MAGYNPNEEIRNIQNVNHMFQFSVIFRRKNFKIGEIVP